MSTMRERGEHGSASTWRQGCRCPACRQAMRRYAQVAKAVANMRGGREPASLVPTWRMLRHVDELRASGMTITAIAEAAGVGRVTISRARRPGQRVTRIVERRVLGVVAPPAADTWPVDPAPMVEHLAALQAAGAGGLRRIADLAGVDRSTLQRARRGYRVRARVERLVLAVRPPEQLGEIRPHLSPIAGADRPAERTTTPGGRR